MPLLLAGLSAIGAFFLTQSYAETKVLQERERLLPKGGLIEVLVAARDLGSGDIASPQTVAVRRMPQDWSLPGAITPLDFDSINQRRVVRSGQGLADRTLSIQSIKDVSSARLKLGIRSLLNIFGRDLLSTMGFVSSPDIAPFQFPWTRSLRWAGSFSRAIEWTSGALRLRRFSPLKGEFPP